VARLRCAIHRAYPLRHCTPERACSPQRSPRRWRDAFGAFPLRPEPRATLPTETQLIEEFQLRRPKLLDAGNLARSQAHRHARIRRSRRPLRRSLSFTVAKCVPRTGAAAREVPPPYVETGHGVGPPNGASPSSFHRTLGPARSAGFRHRSAASDRHMESALHRTPDRGGATLAIAGRPFHKCPSAILFILVL
jgi:hypothetical protein